ncbi:Queuine tRNA-ribosyltransferase [Waddlia chondrophila 2032/99]|uniref:Queuine tRNA-ribosyltransferase n=2 Tax=Waddlia chondrophila TaxID=71667 RepID=D6YTW9_WADCW|nr:tRNA guanosine(34) transglycosylase Tgt [Waddlia chondrophila]ADI37580.1 queuine tRNA-ribosyltransferase [Waddlia chondrophila WSU 86-1044]CCB91753.1 Queuine tRNA-ribosyltransferase [Waddlia chondrophila 2032/99]
MKFHLIKSDLESKARLGELETAHGKIPTPIFMPVGTRGAVKTITNQHLLEMDAKIILGNTYHLMLRPGMEIMKKAGGLHRLMNWDRPILTDSGGFQVFSLSSLNKVTEEGVYFQSHIDGSRHFLGPEESMEIQKAIGSDIVMAFDECSPYPASRDRIEKAMERTLRWEKRSRDYELGEHQALFAITQGGMFSDLREQSTKELAKIDFDGYAIGGLSVGEPAEMMYEMLDVSEPYLPKDKPRYLMGVGTPRNIIEAVMRGVDLFDCVLPTRNARNGTAFTWSGKVSIKAGKYAEDFTPLDPNLDCYTSQFSKAYIRHLLNVNEITGLSLVTMQNLSFYLDFMEKIRQAIQNETLSEFYANICEIYP